MVECFNKTLCEGLAKVAKTINDWDTYIQPVLFSYQMCELRITSQPSFTLVYGKNPVLAIDNLSKGWELIDRLLEITDKVSQLQTNARRAIKKTQVKLEETFNKKKVKFKKEDLVLYGVSAAKRDQIVKKFFFEIMNILDQMIKFTSISLMKKFFIKFSIWSLFAALTPYTLSWI